MIYALNGTLVDPNSFTDELTKGIETNGGSLILIEEYTATWCQVCAEIEPDVKELASINDDRVALIALHPADGIDNLGNYASSKRILSLFNGSVKQTPTFVIDGEVAFEGAPVMNLLNSKILETQSKKSNYTEISLSVKRINNTINFEIELDSTSSGIINIMIIENEVTSDSFDGLRKFDNVLKEMISINVSDENLISGTSEWVFEINKSDSKTMISAIYYINGDINLEKLGFVASHEIQNENSTSINGAVKIIQGVKESNNNYHIIGIFAIFFSLGIFASLGLLENKNKSYDENE